MTTAGARLKPFTTGTETVAITPGETGTYPIVGAEPATVGAPPVTPSLVAGLSVRLATRVLRSRSGHVCTSAVETAGRPRARVVWAGLTRSQRDSLIAWIRGTLRGPLNAFLIEPDGPGSGTVRVRMVGDPTDTWVNRNGWSVESAVEEVF